MLQSARHVFINGPFYMVMRLYLPSNEAKDLHVATRATAALVAGGNRSDRRDSLSTRQLLYIDRAPRLLPACLGGIIRRVDVIDRERTVAMNLDCGVAVGPRVVRHRRRQGRIRPGTKRCRR